jgi:hypothetical protein
VQVDLNQVGQQYTLIERGPVTYVAAFFAVCTFALLLALVRVVTSHKDEVKQLLNDERERAIRLELVAAGLLKLVEQLGGIVAVRGKRRQPADPLAADAPTVSLRKAGGDDGEG